MVLLGRYCEMGNALVVVSPFVLHFYLHHHYHGHSCFAPSHDRQMLPAIILCPLLTPGETISLYQPPRSTTKWAIITPFAHPNDRVRARIYKHDRLCSSADLVEILEYSEEYRGGEGDRRKFPENGCKYFGEW